MEVGGADSHAGEICPSVVERGSDPITLSSLLLSYPPAVHTRPRHIAARGLEWGP